MLWVMKAPSLRNGAAAGISNSDPRSAVLWNTTVTTARSASPSGASAAWAVVNEVLTRDMPVAWLYHARGVQGRSVRLEQVEMDLRGELVSVARWKRREELR